MRQDYLGPEIYSRESISNKIGGQYRVHLAKENGRDKYCQEGSVGTWGASGVDSWVSCGDESEENSMGDENHFYDYGNLPDEVG